MVGPPFRIVSYRELSVRRGSRGPSGGGLKTDCFVTGPSPAPSSPWHAAQNASYDLFPRWTEAGLSGCGFCNKLSASLFNRGTPLDPIGTEPGGGAHAVEPTAGLTDGTSTSPWYQPQDLTRPMTAPPF